MGRSRCQNGRRPAPHKKVFNAQPIGPRRNGRPSLRWIDGIEKDLLVLRIKNWRTLAREEGWPGKGFLRRPRALDSQTRDEGRNLVKN
ncbi:hypothetical protein TNCV_2084641 [Trichonephila clavipes]|uniref:Uncharacterized protein n=1 Tax=Trichonephila clavipes TaxID=2585209 RepID=A0A8X6RNK9_TRICX|nr:hypothetical protein TNCV_2084641 [Trichonephila clavipes]